MDDPNDLIRRVVEADTDNLMDRIALAGLDPKKDLAGLDLSGLVLAKPDPSRTKQGVTAGALASAVAAAAPIMPRASATGSGVTGTLAGLSVAGAAATGVSVVGGLGGGVALAAGLVAVAAAPFVAVVGAALGAAFF